MMPFLCSLDEESLAIGIVQLGDAVDLRRVLGDQCALLKERKDVNEAVLVCEVLDVFE